MTEPKGYVHWKDAKSVAPELGNCAPDRVKVYMNLKLGCLSVLNAKTNLLYCHAHRIDLANAKFRVQQAGRQRVLRDKRKNVHAYVVGDFMDIDASRDVVSVQDGWKSAHYDPYKKGHFVDEFANKPVHEAHRVVIFDSTPIGYMDYGNEWYLPREWSKNLTVKKYWKTYHHGGRGTL